MSRDTFSRKKDEDDKVANWAPWSPPGNSSSGGRSSSSSAGARSGGARKATGTRRVIGPVCWADMEDPRRNAPGIHLTWEESLSRLGALEGDAQPIGYGRSGVVYRKRMNGLDLAIKTLYLNSLRDRDEATDEELREELLKEVEIYQRYVDLQGQVIPRFFGLRTLQIADCFITEYIGPSFDTFERITEEQCQSALAALSVLHRKGILHGDAELRNIVWSEKLQRSFWIDFSFSKLRRPTHDDAKWKELAKEEHESVKRMLQNPTGVN